METRLSWGGKENGVLLLEGSSPLKHENRERGRILMRGRLSAQGRTHRCTKRVRVRRKGVSAGWGYEGSEGAARAKRSLKALNKRKNWPMTNCCLGRLSKRARVQAGG